MTTFITDVWVFASVSDVDPLPAGSPSYPGRVLWPVKMLARFVRVEGGSWQPVVVRVKGRWDPDPSGDQLIGSVLLRPEKQPDWVRQFVMENRPEDCVS